MTSRLVLQSPLEPSAFLPYLRTFIASGKYANLRATVAYSSVPGVNLLLASLDDAPEPISAQLVIGLDGAITEPTSLELLQAKLGDNVRVFATQEQQSVFHVKAYLFSSHDADKVGALVGSANLTGYGLGRNREGAVAFEEDGQEAAEALEEWQPWWEAVWGASSELTEELLRDYRKLYKRRRRPILFGDRVVIGKIDKAVEPTTADIDKASVLWLDAGKITGGAGNQLELPRAVALFFGLAASANDVDVALWVGAQRSFPNRLHFYQNDMWRMNIDTSIPAVSAGLRDRSVMFKRRKTSGEYSFKVLTDDERTSHRALSHAAGMLGHTIAREYGWF